MTSPLLEIKDLTVRFDVDEGAFNAVEGVSFQVAPGEALGIVGESGCGKSVTALSIPRLIPSPPGRIVQGQVLFHGQDLVQTHVAELRRIRGKTISMIFQEPLSALSPLKKIGDQMAEVLRFHRSMGKKEAWEVSRQWLEKVGIPNVEEKLAAFPYQLSGGMQQRVMIAMALMMDPELIIADEPTTALDVTIQAQVFDLVREMKKDSTSLLLITHDMGVVWEMCDRVLVMYASWIVEEGTREQIFSRPAHPYTRGLLQSIPLLNRHSRRLKAIPGNVPSPMNYPSGCHFRDRCSHAFDRCGEEAPVLQALAEDGHRAACFRARELMDTPLEGTE
jgi:peptide/nickel transport system ATP-binding protein/oligopeptide transport system ATP-binding protein